MKHGTASGYVQGCRCTGCTTANREVVNAWRIKKRREADAKRVGRPRFENRMGNLRHAMTLEEWQEREAADPNCRPVTQPPMQLHPDNHNDLGDGLTPFERIIARGTK